jgi:phosphate transport system permease protein
MLKTQASKFIQKRTTKEILFKNLCKLTVLIYIILISFFVFIIVKSGINAFLTTKVKVSNLEELTLVNSIIASSEENKLKLNEIEEGFPKWLETKGAFSYYYKFNQDYNKKWNNIIATLKEEGRIRVRASSTIITNQDSSNQESAGLLGAIKGTILVAILFLTFASVTGIATGVYISEFTKNKFLKNLISLNISNLASVPPIIYGIFGINILINHFHIPRSSSLLGGLILGFLTLPIIVMVTTDSLKSVPSHLKFSAKALGLSHMQTVLRVCLPFAFPRILTGILLTLSRGISEATPLILIGMASFIQKSPSNFTDPATTIATQIYLWITSPDGSFIEKAYGSIFILLIIIGSINLAASFIRYKVSKRTAIR